LLTVVLISSCFTAVSFGSLRVWQHRGADSVERKYQQQKDMLTGNLGRYINQGAIVAKCMNVIPLGAESIQCMYLRLWTKHWDNPPGGCAPTLGRVAQCAADIRGHGISLAIAVRSCLEAAEAVNYSERCR
jgi:hypothetical protein